MLAEYNVGVGELIVDRCIRDGKEAVVISRSIEKNRSSGSLVDGEDIDNVNLATAVVFKFDSIEQANKFANGFFKENYYGGC